LPQPTTITKPTPGIPIPTSKLKNWPSWRSHFFSNWREDKNMIYAQCKLCNDGHFFSGSKQAFTNFNTHCARIHLDEWNKFTTPGTTIIQNSIKSFVVPTSLHVSRKRQLDDGLTRVVAEGNLSLNILNLKPLREWIEV
jgi:hypothetical protein